MPVGVVRELGCEPLPNSLSFPILALRRHNRVDGRSSRVWMTATLMIFGSSQLTSACEALRTAERKTSIRASEQRRSKRKQVKLNPDGMERRLKNYVDVVETWSVASSGSRSFPSEDR